MLIDCGSDNLVSACRLCEKKQKSYLSMYRMNQATSVETQTNWPKLINTGEAMQWLWRGACRYR